MVQRASRRHQLWVPLRFVLPVAGTLLCLFTHSPLLGENCEAQDCRAAAPSKSGGVTVVLVGSAVQTAQLEPLLREWLGQDFELELAGRETFTLDEALTLPPEAHRLHLWITLGTAGEQGSSTVRLYFAFPERDRFLSRDVPLHDGFSELGRERVVQVVQSSVSAILEGAVGINRQEARERFRLPDEAVLSAPVAKPTPAKPKASAAWELRARAELFYFLAGRGGEGLGHGPGGALELGAERSLWLGGVLAAHYHLPAEVTTNQLSLRFSELSLRTYASLGSAFAPSGLGFGAGAGGGFDVVFVEATPRDESTASAGAVTDLRPVLSAFAAVGHAFGRTRVALSAHLDAQLFDSHYDVQDEAGVSRRQLSAGILEPRVQLGLGVF
jgi:hypothetical protein